MSKQKILIIEDEAIIALNIKNILDIKGYEVCAMGISADEAVKLTVKHNPDLILMDIILKGEKDGITAVEEIKEKHDIAIVYLTAHSDEKTLQRAKKTEPHSYIIKPISREELLSTVEIALYKHEMEMKLKLTQFSVDKTQDAVHWMGPDARFIYVNDAACSTLGYSREELLEMNVHDINPDFPKEVWPAHWEDLRKRGSFMIETIYQAKDGRIFPVEISVNYVKQGNHEFNCAIARDVTDRKKAEEKINEMNKELASSNDELQTSNEELAATNEEFENANEELMQTNEEFEVQNEELIESYKSLAESEERYRSLYHNTPAMLHSIDNKGRLVSVSNLWLEKMGYTGDEVIGRKSTDFLTEESRRHALDTILPEFFKTGQCTDVPYQFVKKSGEVMEVLLSATAERGKNGEVMRSLAVITDITGSKQAEKMQRESEDKYRIFVENINLGVTRIDTDFKILWVNPTIMEWFDKDMDELVGSYCYKEFEQKDKVCGYCPAIKAIATGLPNEAETRGTKSDGTKFFARDMIYPIKKDGKVVAFHKIVEDITERKITENALKESEQKFKNLAEKSLAGIYVIQDGLFKYVNPRHAEIFGYTVKESINILNPIYLVYQEDRQLVKDYIRKREKGNEKSMKYTFRGLTKNKDIIHVEVFGSRTMYEGKPAVIGTLLDITGRKQAEGQVKTSLREKEILLQEIHHRVKNNMQVIISLLNLQSKQIKNKEARRQFKESETRIRSMALVHEKLYMSKNLAHINVREYINSLAKEILGSLSLSKEKIAITINIQKLYLDANKAIPCGLIITELITNALKHAFPQEKKGEIKIDFKKNKKGDFRLTIKDNGIGLSDDFDNKKTATLGYHLINALTMQLEGKLKITGKEGTKVTITFPGK